jgi:hypothetical protein
VLLFCPTGQSENDVLPKFIGGVAADVEACREGRQQRRQRHAPARCRPTVTPRARPRVSH